MRKLILALLLITPIAHADVDDPDYDFIWEAQLCMDYWPAERRALVENGIQWARTVDGMAAIRWANHRAYRVQGEVLTGLVCNDLPLTDIEQGMKTIGDQLFDLYAR